MKFVLRLVLILIMVLTMTGCRSKKRIVTKKKHSKTESVTTKPRTSGPVRNESETTAPTPETSITKPASGMNATEIYIANFSAIAQKKMREHNIPASITLAQGILESGSGRGRLAIEGNNHFGIKCHGWTGAKIYHDDDALQECFRKYTHAEQSFEDHSEFLTSRGRYAKLFDLRVDDYKGWARGLRAAGYATDRKYPEKLIGLIERFQLYKYDQEVLGATPRKPDKTNNVSRLTHKVEKGDTLYSLSRRYNLSVSELQKLNGMTTTNLQLGQVLIVR